MINTLIIQGEVNGESVKTRDGQYSKIYNFPLSIKNEKGQRYTLFCSYFSKSDFLSLFSSGEKALITIQGALDFYSYTDESGMEKSNMKIRVEKILDPTLSTVQGKNNSQCGYNNFQQNGTYFQGSSPFPPSSYYTGGNSFQGGNSSSAFQEENGKTKENTNSERNLYNAQGARESGNKASSFSLFSQGGYEGKGGVSSSDDGIPF